jgi:hypothetical protein
LIAFDIDMSLAGADTGQTRSKRSSTPALRLESHREQVRRGDDHPDPVLANVSRLPFLP